MNLMDIRDGFMWLPIIDIDDYLATPRYWRWLDHLTAGIALVIMHRIFMVGGAWRL